MKRLLMILLLALCLPALCLAEVHVGEPVPEGWDERTILRVTVLETGRSDAMLLECGGEAMMIDGGSNPYSVALRHDMDRRGITHFKYLMNTHPDNDHIEGLRQLMAHGYTADAFISPFPLDMDYSYQQAAVKAAISAGIPWQMIFDGDTLTLGEAEIVIRRCNEIAGRNAHSAVAMVRLGDASMLLCADINGLTQRWFLEHPGQGLRADIIKAPHHGITAMVPAFLSAVNPALVCLTNTAERGSVVVAQAKSRGIPCLASGDGEIVLETDGADWYVVQHAKQGRNR